MPNIKTMMGGKYLRKEDVVRPLLVTVAGLEQQPIQSDTGPAEMKWVMHFSELDKPLVINSTNLQLAAMALGSEETEHWIGKQIVLFVDPNVSMQGKLVGGIRIRARKVVATAPVAPPPPPRFVPPNEDDEDIPF